MRLWMGRDRVDIHGSVCPSAKLVNKLRIIIASVAFSNPNRLGLLSSAVRITWEMTALHSALQMPALDWFHLALSNPKNKFSLWSLQRLGPPRPHWRFWAFQSQVVPVNLFPLKTFLATSLVLNTWRGACTEELFRYGRVQFHVSMSTLLLID